SPQHTRVRSRRRPQLDRSVVATEVKTCPAGTCRWPWAFEPQHTAAPEERTPQVWEAAALIDSKVPSGRVDCPTSSRPQHSTPRSVRMPQVWRSPAVTVRNDPDGASVWP